MTITQKEKFRLWFSFLKLAETDPDCLRGKIDWSRYEGWGKIQTYSSFEKWWKDYGKTLQNPVVREVQSVPENRPPKTIYLEIPLNRSPQRLAKRARHIIESHIKKEFGTQVVTTGGKPRRFGRVNLPAYRRGFYGSAWFTEGRDIRVEYYRNLLDLYRLVFKKLKKHGRSVGVPTLKTMNAVVERMGKHRPGQLLKRYPHLCLYQTQFTVEKRSFVVSQPNTLVEWNHPNKLDYDDKIVKLRLLNLRRATYSLERIINAVARGEFPGKSVQRP